MQWIELVGPVGSVPLCHAALADNVSSTTTKLGAAVEAILEPHFWFYHRLLCC